MPVHALSTLFRGKFQAALTPTGRLAHVPPQVWTKGWMTHSQPAGTGTEVLAYFAPYLYRIVITNNRLEKCEDGSITCRVKERTRHAWTHRTLPAAECMRRFLQHVLPKGCIIVCYYGVLSPSRRPALAQIRHSWQPAPATPRPRRAAAPETVTRPRSPRRRPCTARHAVGHSSSCSIYYPRKEDRLNE